MHMTNYSPFSLALALLLAGPAAVAQERAAESPEPAANAIPSSTASLPAKSIPVQEDWGIWNRTPRRAGHDPLLALGQRDRAPSPEPIDAAARGEIIAGTAGREEIDLNGWDSSRTASPPPSKPDNGL